MYRVRVVLLAAANTRLFGFVDLCGVEGSNNYTELSGTQRIEVSFTFLVSVECTPYILLQGNKSNRYFLRYFPNPKIELRTHSCCYSEAYLNCLYLETEFNFEP